MLKAFLTVGLLTLLVGCASGAPPSGLERALYQVTTNYFTSIVQVAEINPSNNVVTNVTFRTNIIQAFDLHPRASIETTIQSAGIVSTAFGFGPGGIISTLLLSIYAAWAEWRNSRKSKAVTALTQNIETARAILKIQSTVIDLKYKESIKAEQVEAGVKALVAEVVSTKVNAVKAQETARKILVP